MRSPTFSSLPRSTATRTCCREGVAPARIRCVGNVMIDALVANLSKARASPILERLGLQEKSFAYVTLHRPANVDGATELGAIVAALLQVGADLPVVFAMHPRTAQRCREFGIRLPARGGLRVVEPLGYHDSLRLTESAALVLTDSGGLQEESTWFRTPCLTLRPNTERPVTVTLGSNRLTRLERLTADVGEALRQRGGLGAVPPLWDGRAAGRIVDSLLAIGMKGHPAMSGYILVTAAHNEEAFIGRTCASVLAQTLPPLRWIVVDDASTDGTAAVVERYRAANPGRIELLRVQRAPGRDFRNKVRAFDIGMARARELPFTHVGNLDADIELPADYYAGMLARFRNDPDLGIAGGMVHSCIDGAYVPQNVARDSVAGAVQLFRRDCFDAVGGYLPLRQGGVDAAAEIMARHKGWRVRTFADIKVLEHRRTGTATADPLGARRREGARLHSLGYGLAFFIARCIRRSLEHPPVIGSLTALYGYLASAVRREPVVLPSDVLAYLRDEQRRKLMRVLGLGRGA